MTIDQQTHDDLGMDPPLLGVTDPPQVVLVLGLEVQGGPSQAQGQDHLLKGPVAPNSLVQAQAGAGPVHDLPQQG